MIRLEFDIADFEYGSDYLLFARGDNASNAAEAHRVTGRGTPDPFELMVDAMWLRFISDDSISDFGFSLRYETWGELQ